MKRVIWESVELGGFEKLTGFFEVVLEREEVREEEMVGSECMVFCEGTSCTLAPGSLAITACPGELETDSKQ